MIPRDLPTEPDPKPRNPNAASVRLGGKSLPLRGFDMLSCALTAWPLLRILGETLAHFSPMDLLISAVILIEAAATMPPGPVMRGGRSTPATTYARSLSRLSDEP
jgi:hypothetical protein